VFVLLGRAAVDGIELGKFPNYPKSQNRKNLRKPWKDWLARSKPHEHKV
jgi:hypothetical protein